MHAIPIARPQIDPSHGTPTTESRVQSSTQEFEDVLSAADINISKHASRRMSRRHIDVNAQQAERLVSAIDSASLKGAKTSLVLMKELALVVRIPERTVVTAMSPSAMRNGLVTQIDSAVVI
jgi:flagellar operon protein